MLDPVVTLCNPVGRRPVVPETVDPRDLEIRLRGKDPVHTDGGVAL